MKTHGSWAGAASRIPWHGRAAVGACRRTTGPQGRSVMTGRRRASARSRLPGLRSRLRGLPGCRRVGLGPATRERVIDLIDGDLTAWSRTPGTGRSPGGRSKKCSWTARCSRACAVARSRAGRRSRRWKTTWRSSTGPRRRTSWRTGRHCGPRWRSSSASGPRQGRPICARRARSGVTSMVSPAVSAVDSPGVSRVAGADRRAAAPELRALPFAS